MDEVVLEVRNGDEWNVVGTVSDVEPPGSISIHDTDVRQVYMFGWFEGVAGVWRSTLGTDLETPSFRTITTVGFEQLCALGDGPFELAGIVGDTHAQLRFRLHTTAPM